MGISNTKAKSIVLCDNPMCYRHTAYDTTPVTFHNCSGCKCQYYCSQNCQKFDAEWHKESCVPDRRAAMALLVGVDHSKCPDPICFHDVNLELKVDYVSAWREAVESYTKDADRGIIIMDLFDRHLKSNEIKRAMITKLGALWTLVPS